MGILIAHHFIIRVERRILKLFKSRKDKLLWKYGLITFYGAFPHQATRMVTSRFCGPYFENLWTFLRNLTYRNSPHKLFCIV